MKPRMSPKELMQHVKNTKVFDRVFDKVKYIMDIINFIKFFILYSELIYLYR